MSVDDPVLARVLPIRNHACDPGLPAAEQVATDFLQLVRFGMRDPGDPMVVDTLKVIDSQLGVELPTGMAWYRFTGDGYGERRDGSPFDGAGVGRPWPLLIGERGHYALAAGQDPLPYLRSLTMMTGRAGLLPEQVWDGEPIPERRLFPGKPTGAAMPLVWTHAEFIKLAASIALGAPCDRPRAVWERYRGRRPEATAVMWTPRLPVTRMRPGQRVRVCLCAPALVHWGIDGWQQVSDIPTRDFGLGLHVADLPSASLHDGQRVDLTLFWTASKRWDGRDYRIDVRVNARR